MAGHSAPAGSGRRPTHVRYAVVLVTTLMAVLLYLDRFCVGFAVDYIREDLGLSQRHISWFLSAFFWSYALAQVPSGWLSDRFGARGMLTAYILSWSFFTAMIGLVYTLPLLLVMRLGCGLGQAGAYPTSAGAVSKWVPFAARGTASGVISFGGRCGAALAPITTAWLIVLFVPLGTPVAFEAGQVLDAGRLAARLAPAESDEKPVGTVPSAAGDHVWSLLSGDERRVVAKLAADHRRLEREQRRLELTSPAERPGVEASDAAARTASIESEDDAALLAALNRLIASDVDLYDGEAFRDVNLVREALSTLGRIEHGEPVTSDERRRFHRLLLEGAFPGELGKLYTRGWRPVMVVYGLAGLFVAALYWLLVRNRPEEHPSVNSAERELIARGRPATAPGPYGRPGRVPMRRLVTSRSMWLICVMQVGTNVGWLFLVTWLPRYLIDVHRLPILQRGLLASIPPLVGIVGMLAGGPLTDALTARFGVRWGRRLPMMVTRFTAAFGYGLALWLSTFTGDSVLASPWAFTLAFSIVAFSTDMGTASSWAYMQDVGGRYVGSILGWGNMWGNLGAAVSPLVYDYFLGEHPAVGDWNNMFLVCLAAFVVAGLCGLGVDATRAIAPADESDGAVQGRAGPAERHS
ncbi:MAG TPA: MFS transporter [Planctomycetaceae bacterium]|nr:MFS transporter [Planctomycetaceae bacterium]